MRAPHVEGRPAPGYRPRGRLIELWIDRLPSSRQLWWVTGHPLALTFVVRRIRREKLGEVEVFDRGRRLCFTPCWGVWGRAYQVATGGFKLPVHPLDAIEKGGL